MLETAGSAEADRTAAGHPDLATEPDAAPLLSRIDSDLGRKDQALLRLKSALERAPTDAVIQDTYIQTAIDLKMVDRSAGGGGALPASVPEPPRRPALFP